MTNKNDKKTERVVPESGALVLSIVRAIADTTWRMFTPPLVFVSAGIWADLKLHTKPWITIVFALIGLGLSVVLVRQQLRGAQ